MIECIKSINFTFNCFSNLCKPSVAVACFCFTSIWALCAIIIIVWIGDNSENEHLCFDHNKRIRKEERVRQSGIGNTKYEFE